MAVTKTNFMNYIRCPRFISLANIHKEKLESKMTIEEYKKEELKSEIIETLDLMFDEDDEDLVDVKNEQLETMMPYYNEVEILAGKYVSDNFLGNTIYSASTFTQESFDFVDNGIRYLCYVDVYNESDENINIIEVKATTSNKFLKLGYTENKEFISIFEKNEKGIYSIKKEGINVSKLRDKLKKLMNRFDNCGKYVYDLALQRYIIERDLKNNGQNDKEIKFYLAVLNHEYVFDGKYENDKPVYGNDIITLFDFTELTKDMQDLIDIDKKKIERYISLEKVDAFPLGHYCEFKKNTKCKFYNICSAFLPKENSPFNYIGYHHGFKDSDGNKYSAFDLVNDGVVNLVDVPDEYLSRKNNQIQKDVTLNDKTYFNKEKIKDGLSLLNYPIYHLDFETFPCPLPRYSGEKCYTQSVFQYSLHIERKPGICDKDKDHKEFLALDHSDVRLELVKSLCDDIPMDSGTVLVYNQSFEKSRLKELASLFPKYKKHLDNINDNIFDLLYLLKSNTKLYESLGYEKDEAGLFNYYNSKMSGSFSIKKVLPVFSDLTYNGMEVANGQEALVTYARFPLMNKKEYDEKYKALLEYCKQDTWAMVEILNEIRNLL